ncbi:MAG: pilin [Rudaea sp.]
MQPSRWISAIWIVVAIGIAPQLNAQSVFTAAATIKQRNQIAEAMRISDDAKTAVIEYFVQNEKYPPDNAASGLPAPKEIHNRYATSLEVKHGLIEITLGGEAVDALQGKHIMLRPAPLDASGLRLNWSCVSPDIPRIDRPLECQ